MHTGTTVAVEEAPDSIAPGQDSEDCLSTNYKKVFNNDQLSKLSDKVTEALTIHMGLKEILTNTEKLSEEYSNYLAKTLTLTNQLLSLGINQDLSQLSSLGKSNPKNQFNFIATSLQAVSTELQESLSINVPGSVYTMTLDNPLPDQTPLDNEPAKPQEDALFKVQEEMDSKQNGYDKTGLKSLYTGQQFYSNLVDAADYNCGFDECPLFSYSMDVLGVPEDEVDLSTFVLSKLDGSARKALAASEFGLPKERRFPLNDKAHVLAALRMFKLGKNLSDAQKSSLKAKIHAKAKEYGIEVASAEKP